MTYTAVTLRDGADVLRFRLKSPVSAEGWRGRLGLLLLHRGIRLLGIRLELEEGDSR